MSPTKHARKKPWRNQSQSGASSPLANEPTVYDYDSGCITSKNTLNTIYTHIQAVFLVFFAN